MSSFSNFQSENQKTTRNRYDTRNPELNPTVNPQGEKELDSFTKNLDKYIDFVAWARWNPDLFWDLITPETGGIRLDLDQRVYLRSIARFISNYMVFPRGYGKTLLEFMGMVHSALFFPDIEISLTAQTRENAAKLVDEKFREILKFYPLIQNEIMGKPQLSKDSVEIVFTSGGRIDVMANAQSSKGARRKRLNCEESALLNNALFEDVLEPIVNVPRRTIGRKALIDPEELNGQINFMTTSWFRGSDEFERNIQMIDDMAELRGKIVLGSDWQLACTFGRGETKSQILDKKSKLSPTFFAMNYCSRWVGVTDNALVDINKVMELRTIPKPDIKPDKNYRYLVSMDVARSSSDANNQSSIAVLKYKKGKKGNVTVIKLVNLINLPNGLNFSAQTVELKRISNLYEADVVVVDCNGIGSAIKDEALKSTTDPLTGKDLGCWDTLNTDDEPEEMGAKKILYALTAQGINSDIIISFIDAIESKKFQLLDKKSNSDYDASDKENFNALILPHIQTDLLLEEVANLKLKMNQNGKYTVEQVTKRVNKDRYSATAMGLWYIKEFLDKFEKETQKFDINKLFMFKQPKSY
jgi:ribonucleoside-diphosphate reductase alpha chain